MTEKPRLMSWGYGFKHLPSADDDYRTKCGISVPFDRDPERWRFDEIAVKSRCQRCFPPKWNFAAPSEVE